MLESEILDYLRRHGPVTQVALRQATRVTAPTLRAWLAKLKNEVLVVRDGRNTRVAARRRIEGVETPLPVYEGSAGTPELELALTLHPLEPDGYYVESHVDRVESGFHNIDPRAMPHDPYCSLPWFLLDAKPAGYLGALAAQRWAEPRNLPSNLARWSDEDVLRFSTRDTMEISGAFVLGENVRRFQEVQRRDPFLGLPLTAREEIYAYWSRSLAEGGPYGGSMSPGGEQPKFSAVFTGVGRAPDYRLVKFSPPLQSPEGRRLADLLIAEHHAHRTLQDHGVPACESEVLFVGEDDAERCYLDVQRFDRTEHFGRVGMVSLGALIPPDHPAHDMKRWPMGTAYLLEEGRIAARDHDRAKWLHCFGVCIANTDMHAGNLSFTLRGTQVTGLTPVYDMLPMRFAPNRAGVPSLDYDPRSELDVRIPSAMRAAGDFWKRVGADERVSDAFRAAAERMGSYIGSS